MNHKLGSQIISTLQSVLRRAPTDPATSLHEPVFRGREWEYLKECVDTGYVSSVGKFVDGFERKLESITGAKHAIACVNGTSALQICCQLVGVRPDDEVLVPSLTFVGSANAIALNGAVPHFVDCDEATLGIDASKLSNYLNDILVSKNGACVNRYTGKKIAAVMGVHIFGHPFRAEDLVGVCAHFGLPLIEDCAESLGSFYKGRHTGNFGIVSALSFNGNKIVTTGGGGAVVTNDSDLGHLAKRLTTTAKQPHPWEFFHDFTAYNMRLPNINAALGCAQLEQLPEFLKSKRALARKYMEAFADIPGVCVLTEPEGCTSNYWLSALVLDNTYREARNEIIASTHEAGLLTRPVWTPMHLLPMYSGNPRMDLSVTENMAQRVINIPSSSGLYESSLRANG